MQRIIFILFIAVGMILTAAFSTQAQKVQVGADRTVDLLTYKTYTWKSEKPAPNPIISQMIVSAVDSELAAKGLRKVESEPDMIVVAWAAIESDLHISNPSWTPAMGSINTGIVVGAQSWPVTKGTLVVNLSDAKTKNELWRGSATDTLNHGPTGDRKRDAKTVEKPIKKSVAKMFKQYPRPSGK
jgi:hypothetical protein